LASLDAGLRKRHSGLVLRRGAAGEAIPALVEETGAAAVYWNRRYEPAALEADGPLEQALQARGVEARSFNAALLHEPRTLRTGKGEPYKVFTPFWKALAASGDPEPPLPPPERLPQATLPQDDALDDWKLRPSRRHCSGSTTFSTRR
jgi:deoxyribodipyrimidine photo-lyase